MGTVLQRLLSQYEGIFRKINAGTLPVRIYPGSDVLLADYRGISNATQADDFFAKFGVGNTVEVINGPFERQWAYELLLIILKEHDPDQYNRIHKGTPYYFIAWTAYQYFNFSKAIFYMDAAVSEDLKFADVQNRISTRPSLDFFLLNAIHGPTGLTAHTALFDVVSKTINDYHTNGGGTITIDDLRTKFIEDQLYSGAKERSVLTALYTFLLQFQEREREIILRSDTGGSIQPFLDHLFDGARILESLLEQHGGAGSTLYPKIVNTSALSVTQSSLKGGSQTLNNAETEFNNHAILGSPFQDKNFAASYIIRNTTGHSLLWPDQFATANSYKILYSSLINSIFWTIEKLWL